jgi:hypothetical protein
VPTPQSSKKSEAPASSKKSEKSMAVATDTYQPPSSYEDIVNPEPEDINDGEEFEEIEKMDFVIPRINSAATDPAHVGSIDPDQTPTCSDKADLFDSS